MSDPKKWWLISDEDIKEIQMALGESHQEDALHTLHSGLHETDCIPSDWKEAIQ